MIKILALLFVAMAIVCTVVLVTNYVTSNRIDSWLDRAKDAGNPQQVVEFLNEYKIALYNNDRVEGRYTSFLKYPGGKMTTYVRVIDGLIIRAEDLSKQTATDLSYQMGLTNLEKDLGDIEHAAFSVWVASGGIWIVCGLVIGSLSLPLLLSSLLSSTAFRLAEDTGVRR